MNIVVDRQIVASPDPEACHSFPSVSCHTDCASDAWQIDFDCTACHCIRNLVAIVERHKLERLDLNLELSQRVVIDEWNLPFVVRSLVAHCNLVDSCWRLEDRRVIRVFLLPLAFLEVSLLVLLYHETIGIWVEVLDVVLDLSRRFAAGLVECRRILVCLSIDSGPLLVDLENFGNLSSSFVYATNFCRPKVEEDSVVVSQSNPDFDKHLNFDRISQPRSLVNYSEDASGLELD